MQHFLFDFDGTLVDSMPTWAGVHIRALKEAGIPVPADFVETITPLGNYNASKYVLSLGLNRDLEEYLDEVSRVLYREYTTRIGLKPYVREALLHLRENGVRIHVLTASPHLYVDACLQRAGVYGLFEHVWSIDDFGLTKAQPEIYREAAKRLHAAVSDCTMVDDNFTAISTAKQAGMGTLAVFDESSRSAESALRETADRYITDFSALL